MSNRFSTNRAVNFTGVLLAEWAPVGNCRSSQATMNCKKVEGKDFNTTFVDKNKDVEVVENILYNSEGRVNLLLYQ